MAWNVEHTDEFAAWYRDLNEAQQRLRRLASVFRLRFAAVGPSEWDRRRERFAAKVG